jgi:acyl-ACP thioesterase
MIERDGLWLESRTIPFYFTDTRRQLSLTGFSNLFQDIANNHAGAHGLGLLDLLPQNRFWVLNRIKIDIKRFPELTETIDFCTWIQDIKASFPFRHLTLTDKNNEIVGSGVSVWTLIDGHTRRPTRLYPADFPIRAALTAPCEAPQKLFPLTEYHAERTHTVLYSELDMMGHVNNVKYMQWILDYAPLDPLRFRPMGIDINYLNETTFPDSVTIHYQQENEATFLVSILKNSNGKEVARGKVVYFEING